MGELEASQSGGGVVHPRAVLTMIASPGLLGDELTDVSGYRLRFSGGRSTPRVIPAGTNIVYL